MPNTNSERDNREIINSSAFSRENSGFWSGRKTSVAPKGSHVATTSQHQNQLTS